jgi:hypothetical protein
VKILYLCQRIPFPPDRGDRIPVYHQILHLSKKHEVVVGSLAHSGTSKNAEMFEKELGVKLLAPDHYRLRQISGMVSAFLQRQPLSLGYFRNSELQKLIDAEMAESRFEVVIIFSSSMAQYAENRGSRHQRRPFKNHHVCNSLFELQTSVPVIMHFCDVDSLKWESLARKSYWPLNWIYRRENRTLLAYERKIAALFDASCVVSRNEAELFRKYIPGGAEHWVCA